MSSPKKWFWGLLPIAGLLLVAGLSRQGSVESDLVAKGAEGLASSGFAWAKVAMQGRDAVLTGEAPDPGLKGMAMEAADRVFGIRLVHDKMTVLPEAKPFALNAVLDGARLTLTGVVAPGPMRSQIVEAARKAFPTAQIDDQMKAARGAPAGFSGQVGFGLGELSKLSSGQMSLSDAAFSISGRAADLPKFADVRAKIAALPAGLTLAKGLGAGDILPPLVKPFIFAAEKTETGVVLTGFVPNEATRAAILSAASALGKPVTDRLQWGDGASATFPAQAGFGLAELGKLATGQMSLSDSALSITGRAADLAKFADIRTKLASLPSGMSLAKGLGAGDILAPVVKPYVFQAEKTASALTLTGFAPNEATRAAILSAAQALGKPVTDRMQIADGAGANYAEHVRFGLGQLAGLATGQAALSDSALAVSGHAGTVEALDQVRGRLASLPAGLTLSRGLGAADITSPAIRPYLFNAVRGERELTLTGFAPDARTKSDIVEQAKKFFEGDKITDALQLGVGAPQGFAAAIRGGLQDLSRLMPGATLSLSDASIALRGLAPLDTARDQAIAAFRARVPTAYGSSVEINTAPPPPVIAASGECNLLFEDLLSRSAVNFETGSATIAVESFGLLDRLVVVVRRCESARVEISGHTDSVGSADGNKLLSENRAKAVVEYLARAGISGERIEARGYGLERPIASNDTADGRAKNRRIEFKVQ